MEQEDTKLCSNCKREIPAINFTTHSVHCARNIRPCPVCKEPVPVSQLEEHHDSLHKEVPCKKCGESVCGTDLEDHIRDSCAQTIKPCRYCELELPRRSLPGHETYCGARSEQCQDCGEYVMAKYRQLHRDSNHGFIRLDEDPVPPQAKPKPKPVTNGFTNIPAASASRAPRTEIRHFNAPGASDNRSAQSSKNPKSVRSSKVDNNIAATSRTSNSDNRFADTSRNSSSDNRFADSSRNSNSDNRYADTSRNSNANNRSSNVDNDFEFLRGLNTDYGYVDNRFVDSRSSNVDNRYADSRSSNVDNRYADSRSSNVDNRYADSRSSNVDNMPGESSRSSIVYKSVIEAYRDAHRSKAKRTNDQPQINTNVEPTEKVNKQLPSRGAVKKRAAPPPPADARRDNSYLSASRRQQDEERQRREPTAYNLSVGLPPVLSAAEKLEKLRKMDALQNRETDTQDYKNCLQGRVWQPADVPTGHVLGSRGDAGPSGGQLNGDDFSRLQPMSQEQFMDRFSRLQVNGGRGDRFDEIKTSLRELRRGLNEVTAPYNNTNNTEFLHHEPGGDSEPDLWLPCEFCGAPLPADDLVLHQTGCRPDLARLDPATLPPPSPPPRRRPPPPRGEPVIPCEFCGESLPVYLISDHQEHCRRESNILYPD